MSSVDEGLWYAIQIIPNQRRTAEFNLKRQNFDYFFPSLIDKKLNKTDDLFKGYGFVRLDLRHQHWTPVNSTRGVVHLVPKTRDIPIPFRPGFVESLIENDPVTINDFVDIMEEIQPGSMVEIADGLYRGDRAVVSSIKNRMVELIFNQNNGFFLGKSRLYVDIGHIKPI